MFPIVLHLMTSPFLRSKMLNQKLIEDISFFLNHMGTRFCSSDTFPHSLPSPFFSIEDLTFLSNEDDFKSTILLIAEAISQNTSIVVEHHVLLVTHLLPALVRRLFTSPLNTTSAPNTTTASEVNTSPDIRFLSLKISIDLFTELFNPHHSIYNVSLFTSELSFTSTHPFFSIADEFRFDHHETIERNCYKTLITQLSAIAH